MRRKIISCFREFWNWIQKTFADKRGELPIGIKPVTNEVIEREVVVNNTKVHIKSIFAGKTSLDKALKNIVARKISDAKSDQ